MTDEAKEQKEERLNIAGGFCENCGKSLVGTSPQASHRIGQTTTNYKRFGTFFINSVENIKICCSLECNADVDVHKSIGNELEVLADILIYETNRRIGKKGLDYITDKLLETYKKGGYCDSSKQMEQENV